MARDNQKDQMKRKYRWQIRIGNNVSSIREDLRNFIQFTKNTNNSKHIERTIAKLKFKMPEKTLVEKDDRLKQK